MKLVYSDKKTGLTAQAEIPKDRESILMGKIIGDIIDGSIAGLDAYKLQITGLSDKTGAPSRKAIDGSRKSFSLLGGGVGIRNAKKGYRARRLVRGNAISADTEQVNAVITEYGTKPAADIFPKKEKAEKTEKK